MRVPLLGSSLVTVSSVLQSTFFMTLMINGGGAQGGSPSDLLFYNGSYGGIYLPSSRTLPHSLHWLHFSSSVQFSTHPTALGRHSLVWVQVTITDWVVTRVWLKSPNPWLFYGFLLANFFWHTFLKSCTSFQVLVKDVGSMGQRTYLWSWPFVVKPSDQHCLR